MEQSVDERRLTQSTDTVGLVPNNIARRRRQLRIPARQVAEQMAAITLPIFSTIENGRVMPKKSDLKVMCKVLRCRPTDLYPADQLALTEDANQTTSKEAASPASIDRGHPGQVEFRAWLRVDERQTLRDAVMALGYRNEAEWLREMYRNTVARRRRLEIQSAKR